MSTKPLRYLGAAALCAMLAAGCGHPPKLRPLAQDAVIVAFGDSLTAGVGAGAGETYPDVLQRKLGCTVVNAGIPGETTDDGLKRLASVLDQSRPALVILCEGGNDMLERDEASGIEANLKTMIGQIRAAGADVVLVGVPRPGLRLKTAEFYPKLAREMKVPCECEALQDILSRPGLKSDQLHPNPEGYARWASAIEGVIRQGESK